MLGIFLSVHHQPNKYFSSYPKEIISIMKMSLFWMLLPLKDKVFSVQIDVRILPSWKNKSTHLLLMVVPLKPQSYCKE